MDKKTKFDNWRVKCKLFAGLPPEHKFSQDGYMSAKSWVGSISRAWNGHSRVDTVNHINELIVEGFEIATKYPKTWDVIRNEVHSFLIPVQHLIEVYNGDPCTVSKLKLIVDKINDFYRLELVVK